MEVHLARGKRLRTSAVLAKKQSVLTNLLNVVHFKPPRRLSFPRFPKNIWAMTRAKQRAVSRLFSLSFLRLGEAVSLVCSTHIHTEKSIQGIS